VIVQFFVHRRRENIHVVIRFHNGFYAFGSRDQANELDIFAARLFDDPDSFNGRAARRQHGIHNYDVPLLNVRGKLAVIIDGLKRLRIPVQPDVTDLSRGDKVHHPVHHAESRS
jgi:hypothetical protein